MRNLRTAFTGVAFIALILTLCSNTAGAQRAKKRFSRSDEKLIREAAANSIDELVRFLNFSTSSDLTKDDIDDAVERHFSGDARIFFQDNFEMDDDTDPENNEAGKHLIKVRDYMSQFRNHYVAKGDNSVSSKITSVSNILIGQQHNFLRVYYTVTFRGKTPDGKAFPAKRLEVAEMQIIEARGRYSALINAINFANKQEDNTADVKAVITDDEEGSNTSGTQAMTAAYYDGKLKKGVRFAAENNFVDAFYSLKEAKGGPDETRAEASAELEKLNSKMRGRNIEINDFLTKELIARGHQLAQKHHYEEAKKYYNYAIEASPEKGIAINTAMQGMDEKADRERPMFALLDKGSYSEAMQGFEGALRNDAHNANLQLGLARANAGLGNYKAADRAFANAIAEDPSRAEIYWWQSRMLVQSKSYDKAYDALVKYKFYAEESAEPDVDARIAYTRGMILYGQNNFAAALDSFKNANIPEAQLSAANIYVQQRDYTQAGKAIENLLRANDKSADAYYLRARVLVGTINANNVDRNRKEALEALKTAVSLDNKNYRWHYELANLQLDNKLYEDAIQSFNACMANSGSTSLKPAFWGRGKCYYQLGRDDEAFRDFRLYADSSGMAPPPAFYVDYGRLLVRMGRYDDANRYLRLAGENKDAYLALGVSGYLQNPAKADVYMSMFEKAFVKGVSKESVGGDPFVHRLYDTNRDFRSLAKKYGYSSVM